MRRRRGQNGFHLAQFAINVRKMLEESRQGRRADGKVIPHLDVAVAQFTRTYFEPLLGRRLSNPQKVVRKVLAKPPVDLAKSFRRDRTTHDAAAVYPALDCDMRRSFELQVPLFRVLAVVVLEGALDVDRVRVVTLDEIAVIAVHRAHEIGKR
jgi:hypothetical protein